MAPPKRQGHASVAERRKKIAVFVALCVAILVIAVVAVGAIAVLKTNNKAGKKPTIGKLHSVFL